MKYFLSLIFCFFFSCQKSGEVLAPNAFNDYINTDDVQIIDVRTPEEYAAGYISNAVNINFYDSDFKAQIGKLDPSKKVAVYCKRGGRSGKAAKMFKDLGFEQIADLKGGFDNWKKSKLKIQQ